ncbi:MULTISPECIES: toxin-activating lysine-acyltransferase [Tenebrionibacter/Tenebrionicola group]|uniref:RTX toxin-activating lysine-acyltransferase n=2 Tax=Tenebrionibacter/Tenebrionicola group TaxID=2969848 RepID=A0A8K0V4P4_9ENTR|nr:MULTISPECIES: toxin-activating lysine-acyltransferase [Tenebrionibacter/Tenebrionicola group]MBK4717008.1 toxin-activating lysine-acyltransferase [Tenebrionibacter intestinalis]MBV4412617.1 toxin-activating lysine-acyltransferase [Tenebrionicola larvae]MBV5097485.1 toxin-activating lysine-acyltransferase [Tenebrionicola larvae]
MRCGDFDIQAPLLFGGQVSEAEILGAAVWLWMHSPMHRDAPLHALPTVLLPVIKHQQYALVSQGERPVFFLSWMWLNAQSETRYLTEPVVMIREEDWRSGDRMWLRDFIAPFGHTREMSRLLRQDILPDACARYLWHRGESVRPCIKTFRGNHVSREAFRAWKRHSAPLSGLIHC